MRKKINNSYLMCGAARNEEKKAICMILGFRNTMLSSILASFDIWTL